MSGSRLCFDENQPVGVFLPHLFGQTKSGKPFATIVLMQYTVLLFYKFTPIDQPELVKSWQKSLCTSLDIQGRIIIGKEGINGTLAGTNKNVRAYRQAMKEVPGYDDIQYKSAMDRRSPFKKLIVKTRLEVVTLGVDVDISKGAPKITPNELHALLGARDDVVLFDARNTYESAIGTFKGAITPNIETFSQLPKKLKDYDHLKDKKVVTFCTGGIRCEKSSVLMKEMGFSDVYQLDGGIIAYGQKYPGGHWQGKCYVFDERTSVAFKDDYEKLGTCVRCSQPESEYVNCPGPACNKHVIMCAACSYQHDLTCSEDCEQAIVAAAK